MIDDKEEVELFGTQPFKLLFRNLVNLEVVSEQAGDLAGIGQHADGPLIYGDCFRLWLTFPASFVVVFETRIRAE